jgi:putative FmdB family regulatory protein
MPTYEYECIHCGENFEVFQKITDPPLDNCPKCHKKVRRLISSGAGIIFKGKGFYATDYRRKTPTATSPDKPKIEIPACPKLKEGCDACQDK